MSRYLRSKFLVRTGVTASLLFLSLLFVPEAWSQSFPVGPATEWGRTFERLFVVVSGAFSMYYGFRLFSLVAGERGDLIAQAGQWEIRLVKVGPGVFFAFFGAAILIYALFKAPSISMSDGPRNVEVRGGFQALELQRGDDHERILGAISTLGAFVTSRQDDADVSALAGPIAALESVQAALIDSRFGDGAYAMWLRLSELQRAPGGTSFRDAMSDERTRMRFNEIDEAVSKRWDDHD